MKTYLGNVLRMTYRGRITRTQFLVGFILIVTLTYFLSLFLYAQLEALRSMLGDTQPSGEWFYFIDCVLMLGFSSFITIRRLHDLGKSAAYYWLTWIPFLSVFVFLWLLFAKGANETNKYDVASRTETVHLKQKGLFGGRINNNNYLLGWIVIIMVCGITIYLSTFFSILGGSSQYAFIAFLLKIFTIVFFIIMSLSLNYRRVQDQGFEGKKSFTDRLVLTWVFSKGDPGPNQFGPSTEKQPFWSSFFGS